MMENLRSLTTIIRRRRDVGLIVAWSILMSTIILYNFNAFHVENPFTMGAFGSPTFTLLERLVVLVMGFVVGFMLSDVKRLVYGYFASMAMTYFIGVISVFLYIWFIVNLGPVFEVIPFGWETVLFTAIIKVFGFMIPIGIIFSLMGVVTGNLLAIFSKYA